MAKAKKLPSGSWRVNQYVGKDADGKRIYKSFTADTKKEAEFMAAEYVLGKKNRQKPENITFGEAMDNYIESKNNILSPTTIVGYKNIRKNHLQHLMSIKLSNIDGRMIQQAINQESAQYSAKTIKNIHGLVSAVMLDYDEDLRLRTTLPQKEKPELRIPTQEELDQILYQADDSELYMAIILGAFEGLRRSEICALEWSDINFKNRTITINKAMVVDSNNNIVLKKPKSYSGNRKLPIFNNVYPILVSENKKNGRIITMTPNQLSKRFKALLKQLDIEGLRFHDLRHYFASVLLALNIPDKYAMELMGHATPNMLKEVYQHLMSEKQNEVAHDINSYFDKIMQHEMQHSTKNKQQKSAFPAGEAPIDGVAAQGLEPRTLRV